MTKVTSQVELAPVKREDTIGVAGFLSKHFACLPASDWAVQLQKVLWANPNHFDGAPAGWILETPNKEVVGFLGNVTHPFQVDGSEVKAAATSAWCVAPEHRSLGLLLADAFFEQRGIDLFFDTTANAAGGKLFSALGARPVPTGFREAQFWIVKAAEFARAAAEHVTGSQVYGALASLLAAPPIALGERLRQTLVPGGSTGVEILPLQSAGPEWNECWSAWRGSFTTGVRTQQQLQWRLCGGGHHVFAVRRRGGELAGLVAYRVCIDRLLRRLRVTDLWLDPEWLNLLPVVINAGRKIARDLGCSSLEICGLGNLYTSEIRKLLPHRRSLSVPPYFIFARDKELAQSIGRAEGWHPTEYDGDTPFSLGAEEKS